MPLSGRTVTGSSTFSPTHRVTLVAESAMDVGAGTTVTVTAAAYDERGVLFSAACGEAVAGEDGVLRVSELRLPLDRQN